MRAKAESRNEVLTEIRQNIVRDGQHIYVVSPTPLPRFVYTIGVSESAGYEVIFAGASFYDLDEAVEIVDQIASKLKVQSSPLEMMFNVPPFGVFTLRKVDQTWAKQLLLGALDFYGVAELPALQIVPDEAHRTIDVPNMQESWNPARAPIWRWLEDTWDYPVPRKSTGVTNLAALRGERITEVMRWEEDEWELFSGAGPDVPKEDMRVVPLGTLIEADQSLLPILGLTTGAGCWRDDATDWAPWGR